MIEPPEQLQRCHWLITRRLSPQEQGAWLPFVEKNNIGNFPCFYVFRGYAKSGRKTWLRMLANELKALCVVFRATHLYHLLMTRDSSKANWNSWLERWKRLQPCILVIEDCEWWWQDDSDHNNNNNNNSVDRGEEWNQWIQAIQSLSKETDSIAIIAICDTFAYLPDSIRSLSGMMVHFPLPSATARQQIISQMTNDSHVWQREEILDASHGLTVGELKDSLAAIRKDIANPQLWKWLKAFWQRKRERRWNNLALLGIRIVFPNQIKDEILPSLYGLDSIVQELEMTLGNTCSGVVAHPQDIRGFLFYGPPGTGKTSLAKKLAQSVRATFLSVDVSNLIDCYVGESERLLRMLFQQAKEMAPCVMFFDEVDALFNRRQRSPDMPLMRWRSSFILELDDCQRDEQVYIVAATNRPWEIDQSLLQQGRLSKHFYVALPDLQARTQILLHHFRHWWPSLSTTEEDSARLASFAQRIAEMTESFSGADLEGLVRRAVLVRCWKKTEDMTRAISEEDILEALHFCYPSVTLEEQRLYETWKQSTH